MAKYEHLKIYKSAFDLALYFEKIVLCFSRYRLMERKIALEFNPTPNKFKSKGVSGINA
jgi:hypothetical protein